MMHLVDILEHLFGEVVGVGELRRWELQRQWRASFAPQLESWAGPLRDHCWHALSYGLVSSRRGADATDVFEEHLRPGVVLLATEEPSLAPSYRVVSTRAITYGELSEKWVGDLYLISEDWSWSFVMTHEGAALGPYFVESDLGFAGEAG
ncbi:MAG: hypothetical protein BGO98_14620 [Myxococcales bacterium 68-20]|nr:DUF4275 family protein [Myxococcales bacterium]OJY31312.1 MAG: hypothetical protein BGO98_14620 [Myxococcales bacterium 68-20]